MKTNDYQPPLTAEDVVDNFIRTPESIRSWCQLVCDIKALIIQQTAAKDARIAELEVKQMGYLAFIETVETERDALQAKLNDTNAQLAMIQWQPIETAPKDGEQFLINSGKPYGYAYCTDSEDIEWFYETYRSQGWTNSLTSLATHWMPLPQSPDQTKTTTEQWLADHDAKLLKPWRDLVEDMFMEVDNEKASVELRKQYEALKATEGLA